MKICEYLRSRPFLDLGPMSFTNETLTCLSQKPLAHFQPNFKCKLVSKLMKIHQHNAGHMTKMAVMPIYGKTLKSLLCRNHWADFDETLYETSET